MSCHLFIQWSFKVLKLECWPQCWALGTVACKKQCHPEDRLMTGAVVEVAYVLARRGRLDGTVGSSRQLGNMRGGPFRTEDPVFVGHF